MDPFTNKPYNFNETRNAEPRETEFNNDIREITVRPAAKASLARAHFKAQLTELFFEVFLSQALS